MSPRTKRFHSNIHFPPNWEELAKTFIESISRNPIVFSMHSVDRITSYTDDYGNILWKHIVQTIKNGIGNSGTMFEFYLKDGNIVSKACFRYSFENFPVDIVMVISSDSTIITIMTTNKGDNHSTLDKTLYERS